MVKYKKMRDLVVNVLNQDFLRVRFCQIKMFSHLCNTFRIGSNLLYLRQLKPSLFLQFPDGALLRSLIHIHETARECPASLKRLGTSLNQQHLWLCLSCHHHTVSRHCRSWIFICVCHISKVSLASRSYFYNFTSVYFF